MFSVNLLVLGKLKEKYLSMAVDEYTKRLAAFCKFRIVEIPEYRLTENPSQKEIEIALQYECRQIGAYLSKSSYNYAMCIEGKQLSSEEFAKSLIDISNSGKSTLNFIIGSSFGLSDEIKNISDFKLSISKMTFPHQLARVMLIEQIYRAFSINNNSKYHK